MRYTIEKYFYSIIVLTTIQLTAHAQTSVNPDISVIPRFLIESNDGERLDQGQRKFSRPNLSFEELEVVAQAYLNPFAKAAVVLTLPGPDLKANKLGIEEVYGDVVRGLPLDLNVRLGKYRIEFGKLNIVHPHALPFITQPLSQKYFFGEDGLNDLGISISTLLPTGDIATKLSFDILRGSAIGEATGIDDTTGASPFYSNAIRLTSFFPLTDESDLEAGLSGYTGIHDPYNRDRFYYANFDFKYKYRPSSYTSLTLQGEYLYNTRKISPDTMRIIAAELSSNQIYKTINTSGLYFYADYQFFKTYSIGVRYDWTQSPYSKENKAQAVAIFFGYYPVEETLGIRLQYQNTKTETPGMVARSINSVALQVLFSLGPHKAHPF